MSKLRPILKSLEKAADARKGLGKSIRIFDPDQPAGDLGFIDDIGEYNRVRGKLDKASGVAPSPRGVQEEIVRQRASQEATRRLDSVTNPKADIDYLDQTANAEEFKVRYNEQLKDPEYARRSGLVDDTSPELERLTTMVGESRARHDTMVSDILGGLTANPRWKNNYEKWAGDSAYKNEIQFHVDVRTDPTSPDRLIQYDKPRQGGVHIGSNRAAESAPGMKEVEEFWKVQDEIQSSIEQLAQAAEVPVKKLQNTIGGYINNFKLRQFSKAHGEESVMLTMGEVYKEWEEMVVEITRRLGDDFGPAATVLASDLMRMPTPNTVPVVFRGKNGLLLQDTGGFNNGEIMDQLRDIYKTPEDWTAISAAMSGADEFAITKNIQTFIESKGFDHIIYHNTVEDQGSLSIINWNEDLMKNVWDSEFYSVPSVKGDTAISSAIIMGVLGLGGTGAALRTEK